MSTVFGRGGSREAFLYAFDLLELDDQDLRVKRWDNRRVLLARLLTGAGEASACASTSRTRMAQSSSAPRATWGSKASSPSGGISRTDQGARRIG
jgi:ATP-dependent DNA ligase